MSIFVGVEEGLVPEKQQTFNVTGHPYSEHRWEKGKYGQEIKTAFFNQQGTIKIKTRVIKCSQITNEQKIRNKRV